MTTSAAAYSELDAALAKLQQIRELCGKASYEYDPWQDDWKGPRYVYVHDILIVLDGTHG